MILYHGSNVEVPKPMILPSKRLLDFGTGFYLTSDIEQASKWAVRTANRREEGTPLISAFYADEGELKKLNLLTFDAPNQEWLRYIAKHRTDAAFEDDYDVTIGPVANDQAIRTVNNFLKGYLTEDMAIQLLLPQKLKDQYAFKTQAALSVLRFCEVKSV